MKKEKMKRALAFVLTAVMAVSVSSVMAFADSGTAPYKYTAGDWTVADGYGSATQDANDSNVTLIKGGKTNEDGYLVGPYSKAGAQKFTEDNATLVQEVNVFIDPAAEHEYVKDNGVIFILSSALNNESGNYTAEGSYMAQKSGDTVYVDNTIQITEKDVYTFRIENTKTENSVSQTLKVLKRGDVIGTTTAQLDNTDGVPIGERYIWFSNINVNDGLKVYTDVPAYTISLNAQEWSVETGNVYALTATVGPDFADKNVIWTSSDENVVTVEQEIGENGEEIRGIVTAVAPGTATVTAEFNGVTAECVFTVADKAAPGTDEGNQDGTDTGKTEADKQTDKTPKTGDEANLLIPAIVLIAVAAAGTGVLVIRRKTA